MGKSLQRSALRGESLTVVASPDGPSFVRVIFTWLREGWLPA